MRVVVTAPLIAEIELLARAELEDAEAPAFCVGNAAPSFVLEAAQRLYDKGLVSAPEGGRLTDRGRLAAEQLQEALAILGLE